MTIPILRMETRNKGLSDFLKDSYYNVIHVKCLANK